MLHSINILCCDLWPEALDSTLRGSSEKNFFLLFNFRGQRIERFIESTSKGFSIESTLFSWRSRLGFLNSFCLYGFLTT